MPVITTRFMRPLTSDPDDVDYAAEDIDKDFFNKGTTRLVWKALMEDGIREETGSRVGKTIVFARSHVHAVHLDAVTGRQDRRLLERRYTRVGETRERCRHLRWGERQALAQLNLSSRVVEPDRDQLHPVWPAPTAFLSRWNVAPVPSPDMAMARRVAVLTQRDELGANRRHGRS